MTRVSKLTAHQRNVLLEVQAGRDPHVLKTKHDHHTDLVIQGLIYAGLIRWNMVYSLTAKGCAALKQ